jgi:hypothetical protein
MRRRGRGHDHGRRTDGVLADLQPQPFLFDFELGELVRTDKVEDLFELI